ncbi:unnamed protein product [Ceutorhynchus assimilis]|uniref:C2H2-type domain-containing protein n=1 Tax=Ceutorhynchus assimilis TaxID=467358 RepID=A0A9N9MU58_9CUCU|nr:unnamed protein product [Ceutorhynchus assimilis]
MPRKTLEKICCVCLGTNFKLNKLSAKDANEIDFHTKLKICISDIHWSTSYQICKECIKLLDISYTFRETCLKSEIIRQSEKPEPEDDPFDNKNFKAFYVNGVSEDAVVKQDPEISSQEISDEKLKDEPPNEHDTEEANHEDIETYSSDPECKSEEHQTNPRKKRKKITFVCEKCAQTFNSSTKLVNHCIKYHDMKKIDVRPFICDRCPSRFCNSSNLLQHIKYHDAVRSNVCTYCGKGFITKTDLNIHEKQHLNKREYRCEDCGKCFNTHKDVRSHKLVVHTDANSWKYCCEICQKPFPIKSNYDSHMRRHTGDKKFECHLCQRKFTDKCVLQRHMRTHSNVREFRCSYCDREYKDPRVLRVHMAKIHGVGVGEVKIPSREKKYICHICPKSYYAKNKLTRHLYTHSGEKPYDCHICGKKFNDKSYVKQHLKKTHNMTDTDSHVPNVDNELKLVFTEFGKN